MKKQPHFTAAMYLRLSRNDEDNDGVWKIESDSIDGQRKQIELFLNGQEDIQLYNSYVDDGFSGSNFDRPAFKQMLEDVKAGKVNCIIVKDLSRFGRDYLQTGMYLEQLFPALGVRFIALSDCYDSFFADSREWTVILPVKNFINDSYCRDISIKIKSQLAVKRKAGECLSPFAVYGYQKHPQNKHKLVVDCYAAEIVRTIFAWKIKGMAVSAIAEKLNSFYILSPREYKKLSGLPYRGGFSGNNISKWSSQTVKRILTDEVYLGHLIQGKTEKISYKLNKRIKKPKEEWVRAEYTHEPVISFSDFQIVQNLLNTNIRTSPKTKEKSPFAGLLFCADCKAQMTRRKVCSKINKKIYYICSTKNKGEGCTRHSIEETVLKEIIETTLFRYFNEFSVKEKPFLIEKNLDNQLNLTILCHQEAWLKQEKEKYEQFCSKLYADSSQGIITKEEFNHLQEKFTQKITYLSTAQNKQKEFWNSFLLKENNIHEFSRFIKRIWIYEGKRIKIELWQNNSDTIWMD